MHSQRNLGRASYGRGYLSWISPFTPHHPKPLVLGLFPPIGEDTKVQRSCHLPRVSELVLCGTGIYWDVLLPVPRASPPSPSRNLEPQPGNPQPSRCGLPSCRGLRVSDQTALFAASGLPQKDFKLSPCQVT